MENMNEFVADVTENVEQTTEETQVETPVKTYTDEEVNQIVGKKIARTEAKIRKQYEKKYGDLENVLRAGTGKNNVEEMTDTFKKFYESKGIQFPTEPTYSDRDIAVLAKAEADDIIRMGLDEVIEEVDRLADIGTANMSARERAVFKTLAEYRQTAEQGRELEKIGVTKDLLADKDFTAFAGKFGSNTPITEIYEIYNKMQPRKEIRTMGSMRNNTPSDKGVKDFYTKDEALQFTVEDFNKNPELFKAVERSSYQWK